MSFVRHSKRTLRTPCKDCKQKGERYLAHDTAYSDEYCEDCKVTGKLIIVDADTMLPHFLTCGKDSGKRQDDELNKVDGAEVENKALPAPTPAPAPAPVAGAEAEALNALRTLIGTPQIDRAEVERIAREVVGGVVFPTKTVVVRDNEQREIEGSTHVQLEDVLYTLMGGEYALMVGPAGSGKSSIARQCAEALGLEYYSVSLSPQTPASQVMGYMQATGDYVGTLFRQAYEHGGVFHFDELDNAHPSVLAVINDALASESAAFPDGMVKKHDDFLALASANTYGRGANRTYVARQQLDAATLDRFAVITIGYDEALEETACKATGADDATVRNVLRFVRKVRKNADKNGITQTVISPRASIGMCKMLRAGLSWDKAVEFRLRRGLDDATWTKLTT